MGRIEDLRAARHMTQNEFAEFCGISRSSIARYEACDKISRANAMRIADACGVSVGYVLGLEDEKATAEDDDILMIREQIRNNRNMLALFDAAKKSSPEYIRAAIAVLKSYEPEEQYD